jgi:hypothetical protein
MKTPQPAVEPERPTALPLGSCRTPRVRLTAYRSTRGAPRKYVTNISINRVLECLAFARFVSPMAPPPPFAAANVASMKLSRSSIAPSSRSVFASWVGTSRSTYH